MTRSLTNTRDLGFGDCLIELIRYGGHEPTTRALERRLERIGRELGKTYLRVAGVGAQATPRPARAQDLYDFALGSIPNEHALRGFHAAMKAAKA